MIAEGQLFRELLWAMGSSHQGHVMRLGSQLGCLPSERGPIPLRGAIGRSAGRNGNSKSPEEGSIPSRPAGVCRRLRCSFALSKTGGGTRHLHYGLIVQLGGHYLGKVEIGVRFSIGPRGCA
jgi:hypothetical protein